jgi:hypothetical protein
MKLLMIYCERFTYHPTIKTLGEFEDQQSGQDFTDVLVGFIHAEATDQEDMKKIETKMVKNLKWAAKKNETNNVVLHSFAHLAETKADPVYTKELFDKVESRMKNAGYHCHQTAFGYFMDLDIQAPGVSQARIFTSF